MGKSGKSGVSAKVRALHAAKLRELKPGESFLVESITPDKLTYLRHLGYKLGMRLSLRWVEVDPLYQTRGTRVSRVDDGAAEMDITLQGR